MNPQKSKKPPFNSYARYSGIAFQMLAIILLGVYLGLRLDRWVHWEFPVFTISLSLVSVVLAIYFVVKDLIRKP